MVNNSLTQIVYCEEIQTTSAHPAETEYKTLVFSKCYNSPTLIYFSKRVNSKINKIFYSQNKHFKNQVVFLFTVETKTCSRNIESERHKCMKIPGSIITYKNNYKTKLHPRQKSEPMIWESRQQEDRDIERTYNWTQKRLCRFITCIYEPHITMVCITVSSGYGAAYEHIIYHFYRAGTIPKADSGKNTAQQQHEHTNTL